MLLLQKIFWFRGKDKFYLKNMLLNNISLNMFEVMLPGGLNTHPYNPQYFINISKYIDKKISSIKAYKSVFELNSNNYSNYFDSIMGRAKFRGGVIGVDYAEAFVIAKKIDI